LVLALLALSGLWLTSPRHVSATGISFVQGNARAGSGSSLFTAYPLSVRSGHLLVGVFRAEGSPSVSDNVNGAWNEAASNRFASIWYRPDAKPGVTTVRLTGKSGPLRASIADYSGVAPFIAFVSAACNGGAGSGVTTGSGVWIPAGDLVFAGATTSAYPAAFTAGSIDGKTALMRRHTSTADGAIAAEDMTAAGEGRQNATMTLSSSAPTEWNACIGIFRGPGHSYYWGATIGDQFSDTHAPWDWSTGQTDCTTTATSCSDFERTNANGKTISLVHVLRMWPSSFPALTLDHMRGDGVIPLINWASVGIRDNSGGQSITSGYWDNYITAWAQAAAKWGHPFFLRFDWEMNGPWFDWGVGNNGTTAADYVAAWRHVHDIFIEAGAWNASWVWCPNIDTGGALAPLFPAAGSSLYPGDSEVDWTGLDGYNPGGTSWTSFTNLFQATYITIAHHVPSKPMVVAEVASTSYGGTASNGGKAGWISDMFVALETLFPNVYAVSWFDQCVKGPGGMSDWPLEVSVSATASNCGVLKGTPASQAFASGVGATNFKGNSYSGIAASPIPRP
jgi:hypothetical protein